LCGFGGRTRGGRAVAACCLIFRLLRGGDGGLIVRILGKQRRRSPTDAHTEDDHDHGEERDQSPAPIRCRGGLSVTGSTLRVGLTALRVRLALRIRLLRRLALCVGLTALRVGLLSWWVRRLGGLLRLPRLCTPAGIRLRPGLRSPLAAG